MRIVAAPAGHLPALPARGHGHVRRPLNCMALTWWHWPHKSYSTASRVWPRLSALSGLTRRSCAFSACGRWTAWQVTQVTSRASCGLPGQSICLPSAWHCRTHIVQCVGRHRRFLALPAQTDIVGRIGLILQMLASRPVTGLAPSRLNLVLSTAWFPAACRGWSVPSLWLPPRGNPGRCRCRHRSRREPSVARRPRTVPRGTGWRSARARRVQAEVRSVSAPRLEMRYLSALLGCVRMAFLHTEMSFRSGKQAWGQPGGGALVAHRGASIPFETMGSRHTRNGVGRGPQPSAGRDLRGFTRLRRRCEIPRTSQSQ